MPAHHSSPARVLYQRAVPRVMDGFMADRRRQNFNGTGAPNIEPKQEFVPFTRGRRHGSAATASPPIRSFIMLPRAPASTASIPIGGRLGHGRGRQTEEGAARLQRRRGDRSRQDGEGASRIRYQVRCSETARQAKYLVCGALAAVRMGRAGARRSPRAQYHQGRGRKTSNLLEAAATVARQPDGHYGFGQLQPRGKHFGSPADYP